eukprot:XP_019919914.1 PREDICTED: uncharacterized protein LOC109617710 [Crassostrea gigas]
MFISVKSLITAQRTSSNNSSFFVTGPQATTSGLGARPAEADIRESLGHEIRTRQERSRTNTGISKTERDCNAKEVTYHRFSDERICVLECLCVYLEATKGFRNGDNAETSLIYRFIWECSIIVW